MKGDVYYVIDTVASSVAGKVVFIVKYDPNEVTGWLVAYTPDMQIADRLEVYYKNAEGNFYLSSVIHENMVSCRGDNITPEEYPVSIFKIVKGPRWQLMARTK